MKWTPEQSKIGKGVNALIANHADGKPGYQGAYLWGATGAGKTVLARALAGHGAAWFDAPEIGAEALGAMSKNYGARSQHDILSAAARAFMVIIDDVGREREGYERDIVWRIMNAALNRGRFLIVTSNRSKADLVESYGNDDATASRLELLKDFMFPASMPDFRKRGDS